MRAIQPEIREILGGKSNRTEISEMFDNLGTPFELEIFEFLYSSSAFYSTKNSSLHFPKFPVAKRTVFSTVSGKQDNLGSYTQIFANFLPGSFVPLDFHPGISAIFGWRVRFSEIQEFPDFLKLFPGNFRTICLRVENFGNFGLMESAQSLTWHITYGRNDISIEHKASDRRLSYCLLVLPFKERNKFFNPKSSILCKISAFGLFVKHLYNFAKFSLNIPL